MLFNTNEWYDIPGYNRTYQINTQGQIKSNSNSKKGKLLSQNINNGYKIVGILYKKNQYID